MVKMFVIYDSSAQAYGNPLFMPSKGYAIRALIDAVKGADKMISAHPGDFSLFEVGEYDPQSASFKLLPAPVRVISAAECVSKE